MTLQNAVVLERAADLVAEGWCQGEFARRKSGHGTVPEHRNACRWCAAGALLAAGDDGSARWVLTLALLRGADSGAHVRSIIDWNDAPGRTQGEVVAVLREAAKREREG